MNYVTVHRNGVLVACVHVSSDGLVRLQKKPAKGDSVTFTVLRAPRFEEPAYG